MTHRPRSAALAVRTSFALLAVATCVALSAAACSASNGAGGTGDPPGGGTGEGGSSGASSSGSGSGGEGDGGAGCTPFTSTANLTTPAVHFTADVLPVFQRSCGIAGATCHGTPSVATVDMRPYLGNFDGGTDASAVVKGLVGVTSPEDPKLDIVKAGDPASSYLMHKLDGDQCQFAADCAQGQTQYTDCGQTMPYSSPALDEATRDTIRRWIAQGAKSD
jgi:hypothetical protein